MTETTRIAVHYDGHRARISRLESGRFLGPRPLDVQGRHVRIALVGLCATLLAHDDVRLDIDVGAGVHLDLIEPSGMVAYDARGGRSSWSAKVRVATGAAVTWSCAPLVVAAGADLDRSIDIDLGSGSAMLTRETLVLGRSGETGGRLRSRLRADRDGKPLLREDLDLRDPAARRAPAILGDNRVLATTTLLGTKPPPLVDVHETNLAGPGGQARVMATQAHHVEGVLDDTWRRWRAAVHNELPDAAKTEERRRRGHGPALTAA